MKVEHGGNMKTLALKMGYQLEECIDFSANINPLGLSDKLKKTLEESFSTLIQYPDIDYDLPRSHIAKYHGCDKESVLLANGAVEVFYDLARVLQPKRLLLLSPTFMEYEQAFKQVGTEMVYHRLSSPSYVWSLEGVLKDLAQLNRGDVVLICNPNNPTGQVVGQEELLFLANELSKRGLFFILDEAFVDFLNQEDRYSLIPYLGDFPNLVVVRSLTKFYAIPGLRLGYALTKFPDLWARIEEIRPPWTVNTLAAAAVSCLLEDKDYRSETRKWLVTEQAFLYDGLASFDTLRVVKSSVNYIFFEYLGKLDLRQELWKKKIFIRSCRNYHNLTVNHYRVGIRKREDNRRLLEALDELIGDGYWHEKG